VRINQTKIWNDLQIQQQNIPTLRKLFANDPEREKNFSFSAAGLTLDLSRNHLTQQTLNSLCQLAEAAQLPEQRNALFNGDKINNTENRAVLHTALRQPGAQAPKEVQAVLAQIKNFCEQLHNQQWLGFSGKAITDVVNIGIGGSDLGPKLAVRALKPFRNNNIRNHFVANIDPTDLRETGEGLNPETTLFIVASKTFTTEETLTNAKAARNWLLTASRDEASIAKHFVAVSANPQRAVEFGIAEQNVFAFWDWVGGRYSMWSAVGLAIATSIGFDNFTAMLNGAHELDEHFRSTDFTENLPVLLALTGIWYRNFFHTASQAIIPYAESLELFPNYLQQLDMESNGKQVDKTGNPIDYATGPVIWGGIGSNSQHAFHQLLHQGTDLIPVDFILPQESLNPIGKQHAMLKANCYAQTKALLEGRQVAESYRNMPGNRPSTLITFEKLDPKTLGALVALYEHKVFVQGAIWQINSFDQWGVELGKQLAKELMQ
jgi:glucose-6-phosphate isomerase